MLLGGGLIELLFLSYLRSPQGTAVDKISDEVNSEPFAWSPFSGVCLHRMMVAVVTDGVDRLDDYNVIQAFFINHMHKLLHS